MKTKSFLTYFKQLQDPRSHINNLHEINTILLIGVIAKLCGFIHGKTWRQMEEFEISQKVRKRKRI